MKTNRGFELKHFVDDYGVDCSIQESSSVEPRIWLGVHDPDIRVMYKDRNKLSEINKVKKNYPECNENGWCTINIPEEAFINSRMHLNREQASWLAEELKYFAETGRLKEH